MKHIFILLLSISLFTSCGQSAADKARFEALRQDSIKATQQRIQTNIGVLRNALDQTNAQLAAENDRTTHIQQWQLGRSPAQREDQIQQETLTIQKLQDNVTALNTRIQQLQQQQQ